MNLFDHLITRGISGCEQGAALSRPPQFRAQLSISELPVGEKMLIELYREGEHSLIEAYRQAMHTFLDAEQACLFLDHVQSFRWTLRELAVVSPFSFAMYASKIKESMMLEDPGTAIERIYAETHARVQDATKRG